MKKYIGIFLGTWACVACGGDASTIGSEAEAQAIVTAVGMAQSSAVINGQTNDDFSVMGPCSEGGTLTIGSNGSLTFEDCGENGIVLNGSLEQSGSASGDQTNATVTATISGRLDVTGEVTGICEYNMTSTSTLSEDSVQVTVEGTICGFDAEAITGVSGGTFTGDTGTGGTTATGGTTSG